MDEIDYGKRVRELRGEMTQAEFAALSGIKKRTLQAIESGATTKPNGDTRAKLDAVKAKIEATLGLGSPEQTAETWPRDVKAFLDTLGAFLVYSLPEDEREEWIHRENRRIFEEFGARRRGQ